MLGLNFISFVSSSACYYLATIVDGDHNTDLNVGCARVYVLFSTVAMEDEAYI